MKQEQGTWSPFVFLQVQPFVPGEQGVWQSGGMAGQAN
jgi:hypothetical protein